MVVGVGPGMSRGALLLTGVGVERVGVGLRDIDAPPLTRFQQLGFDLGWHFRFFGTRGPRADLREDKHIDLVGLHVLADRRHCAFVGTSMEDQAAHVQGGHAKRVSSHFGCLKDRVVQPRLKVCRHLLQVVGRIQVGQRGAVRRGRETKLQGLVTRQTLVVVSQLFGVLLRVQGRPTPGHQCAQGRMHIVMGP